MLQNSRHLMLALFVHIQLLEAHIPLLLIQDFISAYIYLQDLKAFKLHRDFLHVLFQDWKCFHQRLADLLIHLIYQLRFHLKQNSLKSIFHIQLIFLYRFLILFDRPDIVLGVPDDQRFSHIHLSQRQYSF